MSFNTFATSVLFTCSAFGKGGSTCHDNGKGVVDNVVTKQQ